MASATFSDKSGPGGIVHNPASAYSREMAKFEMGYNPYGLPGRPREQVGHQEYPALFYKVRRSAAPHEVKQGPFWVEHYTEAADENEARNLQSRGYVRGRGEACAAVEAAEQALSVAAAVRAKDDLNMSEKARAEAAAYEATTAQHVAEIPVAKQRKP